MDQEDKHADFYSVCQNIIQEINSQPEAFYFFKPIDPIQDYAADYYEVIPKPMCLFIVQNKLDNMEYTNPDEFAEDMFLIFQNAKKYNSAESAISRGADTLRKKLMVLLSSLPHFLSKEEKLSGVQRLVELRFLSYRMQKKTHQ